MEKHGSDLILRYRVYQRKGTRSRTYAARITGPHPDFILGRSFIKLWTRSNLRWDQYTCLVTRDGVYEIAVKRCDPAGRLLARERLWLVVCDGEARVYGDEEMNYQYVLYCAALLRGAVKEAG